jgi:hypothetical protein
VAAAAPQSPAWWVDRLYKQLTDRAKVIKTYEDYYCGRHPLPWLAPQAREEFRRILRMTRSNYMGLVVDATAERLQVEGFRLGPAEPAADKETWRIYQANNLDNDVDQALLEALIGGCSYTLVEPNPDDETTPNIYVEHATQTIVEYVPGSNRRKRAAGLKVWIDEWTEKVNATLYLPDGLYKRQSRRKPTDGVVPAWEPRDGDGEFKNPLGVVPLIELANNPRMLTGGVSELADVTDIQDRINKTLADRLMTQDFGAFPQKWAIGWPSEDENGNPTAPIDAARNRMVTSDVKETKFGQWEAAPLDPYSAAKREDVKDIASRTRTPAQYLLGELSNVNGETLRASESGLVSKSRQRMRPYGEGLEETMRLARRIAGLPSDGESEMETIWRNPEFRTEGELVDSLVKMSTLGVPDEVLWERWGATPQEQERWMSLRNAQTARDVGLLTGDVTPKP